jgi:hypothetical protein
VADDENGTPLETLIALIIANYLILFCTGSASKQKADKYILSHTSDILAAAQINKYCDQSYSKISL